jgi:hypothetical protein
VCVGFGVILGVQVYLVIVHVVVGSVNYVSIVNVIPLKDRINLFFFYECQLSVQGGGGGNDDGKCTIHILNLQNLSS